MYKSIFHWSGGKDSALCLYLAQQQNKYDIQHLVTTLSSATRRITMHGVRQELLAQQAQQIGLPLTEVWLPEIADIHTYNQQMEAAADHFVSQGITHAIFGDINLQDLREYREQQLARTGLQAVFPLWGRSTRTLVQEFIAIGFKAVVVCVNARLLDASFVGRELDAHFLEALPPGVDPAGENGEFHTFVYDGPLFTRPVDFIVGEKVKKTYAPAADANTEKPAFDTDFWFSELLP
ncbi:diphthine--ammonia ligase [Pontibacter chitinilyticus]|uniref:Dph6-related ATP pyrophosphatase n=1 Tax=Pontibacter chitinilyticus TaxID=2674989 RepID=UPI003218EDE5